MWPFNPSHQQVYQQYAQAYDTGNFFGIDQNQAFGHIQQFMQGAPQDMQQQIYQQHFAQMPYEQRVALAQQMPPQYGVTPNDPWSMTQGFLRMGQEQPHLLQRIFSHPLLLGSGVALAGLIAKHMLAHHQQQQGYDQGFQNQQQQGYDQAFQSPQAGYNQGFQGQPYNQGNQDPYLQPQLDQERRQEQELRSELQDEEQRLQTIEERERYGHRRREGW